MQNVPALTEWEYFVYRHQNKGNLWFHFASYIAVPVLALICFYLQNYYLLLLFPLASYIGYIGHEICERSTVRSRDFISPMTTVYLTHIWILILRGRYKEEVANINAKAQATGFKETP